MTLTNTSTTVYKNLKDNNEKIEKLKALLSSEQDRYLKQFSQLEKLINKMNTQSSYLSGISG